MAEGATPEADEPATRDSAARTDEAATRDSPARTDEASTTDSPARTDEAQSPDSAAGTATEGSAASDARTEPTVESVLVAGASGGTGRRLLALLDETDLQVRALTSSPEKREGLRERGADEVVVGDLLEDGAAARAVEGGREAGPVPGSVDAVVCAVGSTVPQVLLADRLVDGPGVVNLARASTHAGVERFVLQSAVGAGDSRERAPLPYRLPISRVLEAKGRAEDALRELELVHTIVRPGMLTNGPERGDALVAEGGNTVFGMVSRADVARVMVSALGTPAAENRTFEVVSDRWTWGEQSGVVEIDWVEPGEL